jgi:hypothetical protein
MTIDYGAPRDMPPTPFGDKCGRCGHTRIKVPAANVPNMLVWLCMTCDHGGGHRQTAPILQSYIDRGGAS